MDRITWPWQERNGRISPLKATVFALLLLPGLGILAEIAFGDIGFGGLGARPVSEVIHEIGTWTLRILVLSLAVTPLRRCLDWPRLVLVRRMIGVAAAIYVGIHFVAYCFDEGWNPGLIASEIVKRIYLTIGMAALLGLVALGVTSTDGMIRRLGGRAWNLLHRLVYVIVVLALIHDFMQAKLVVIEPTVMAGFVLWLFGFRLLQRALGGNRRVPAWMLALLAIATGAVVTVGEAFYFNLITHAPVMRILGADFSLVTGLRPGPLVGLIGLALAAVVAVRRLRNPTRGGRAGARKPARSAA